MRIARKIWDTQKYFSSPAGVESPYRPTIHSASLSLPQRLGEWKRSVCTPSSLLWTYSLAITHCWTWLWITKAQRKHWLMANKSTLMCTWTLITRPGPLQGSEHRPVINPHCVHQDEDVPIWCTEGVVYLSFWKALFFFYFMFFLFFIYQVARMFALSARTKSVK